MQQGALRLIRGREPYPCTDQEQATEATHYALEAWLPHHAPCKPHSG
jgi:hypothetical protein